MTRIVNRRPRSFRVPLTDEELAKLHALSELAGVTAAELVRDFIEREYAVKIASVRKPRAKR